MNEILQESGFPVAYYEFPDDEAPPMPFVCYLETDCNNFAADGVVYFSTSDYQVELYTELKSPETESNIESLLNSYGIYWSKTPSAYLSGENCWVTIYSIEV